MSKLYKDRVGYIFTIRTGKELSSVQSAELKIRKPENIGSATWIASISNAGSGELTYIIQSGDFSNAGIYEAQPFIWESSISHFDGETFNFQVFDIWQ